VTPYLADLYAAFAPGAQLAGVGPPSAAPVQSGTVLPALAPPPNASGYPSLDAMAPPAPAVAPPLDPIGPPAGPPAPPPETFGPPNTLGPVGVPQPPPVSAAGPAQAPGPGPDPLAFPLQAVSGGGSPAQELQLRGPKLVHEQDVRNQAVEGAIGTVEQRNENDAAQAYDMALAQERDARARAAAIDQAAAEQEEEMQARQADFDATTKQVSRLGQIDRGRFWASRSTAGKVAGVIEMMLGGLRNAPSMVTKAIDDDVKAQEFAYMAGRDTLNAKQSAFSMAMAKYQQAGAARAVSRAAAIDVMQAQLAQHAATHQGTESANRATMAIAQLQDEKLAQFQQAYRYMPAQSRGRMWTDPRTGLIYTEAEAKAMMAKREEWGQDDRKLAAGVGGQVLLKGMDLEGEHRKEQAKGAGNIVTLPTGETIQAPNDVEARQLRESITSMQETKRLVAQAKEIRSSPTFRISLDGRNRLSQIQADLLTHYGVQHKLGALSDKDYEIALKGTADVFQWGPGAEAKLDQLERTSTADFRNKLRTYPGAPPNAKGEISEAAQKSLQVHRK
jgi:hypothetical protein